MSFWSALLREHKEAFWWIAACSALVFVGSLLVVPWLVVRVPEDYFAVPRRPHLRFADAHPALRWMGLIIKNLVGIALVLAGIAMIFLPGQGLLTITMGVLLLDFPGKHHLEALIIRQRPVWNSVNWLRRRAKVPPLRLDRDTVRHSKATERH